MEPEKTMNDQLESHKICLIMYMYLLTMTCLLQGRSDVLRRNIYAVKCQTVNPLAESAPVTGCI